MKRKGANKGESANAAASSALRLPLWAFGLATGIFALVPLAFDPNAILALPSEAFPPVQFRLLVPLSVALLVAVAGASLVSRRLPLVPLLLPALAFLGISTLSTLFSENIRQSLFGDYYFRYDGLITLSCGVMLFYAAARFLDSWAKVRVFLVAGVTSATIISLYGIIQPFGLDPVLQLNVPWYTPHPVEGPLAEWYVVMPRAFSTLGWPNFLAAYLTLMAGAALVLYFRSQQKWESVLWLGVMALMAACWLYTYTRGAWLGAGVALPIILLLAHRRLGNVKPLLIPLSVIVAAMFVAQLLAPSSSSILSRLEGTNVASTPEEIPVGGDVSVTTRLMMWRDTVPVIAERPLLGHGPDNFAEPFERHKGEDLRAFIPDEQAIDKAHNEFLQVAATTGLLGLAAYLWIFISYFRHAYRSGGWPLLALSGGVLAYILQLQTAFTTIATGVTFWAILGVSVAIMRVQERDDGVNSTEKPGPERGSEEIG